MNESCFLCPECGCPVLKSYATKHVEFHAKIESVREAMRHVAKFVPIPVTHVRVDIDMEPVEMNRSKR